MRQWWPVVVAAVVVLSAGTTPLAAAVDGGSPPGPAQTNATPASNASSPFATQGDLIGQRLSAEAFEIRLQNAPTATARARIVADEVDRVEAQLTLLRQRFETVRAARQSGSVEDDQYESRTGQLLDAAQTLDARVDRIQTAVNQTDESALSEAGVTRERTDTLRSRTDQLRTALESGAGPGGIDREFYRQVRLVADQYNQEFADEDLGVLGTYLSNERVNVQIMQSDGTAEVISFRMTGATRVRDLRAGGHENATIQARLDEATARQVVNSDAPLDAANQAFLSGEIVVRGLTPYNRIKWRLTNTLVDAARALSEAVGV